MPPSDSPLSDRSPNPGALTISTDATGELLAPLLASDTGPAREWAEAADADQVARPEDLSEGDTHLNVMRTFCFADLSGFTAYTREHGPHAAVRQLGEFRRVTRNVAAKLCAAASPGEVLAVTEAGALPDWVTSDGEVTVRINGVGAVGGVHRLRVDTAAS